LAAEPAFLGAGAACTTASAGSDEKGIAIDWGMGVGIAMGR
jgi:hypothetical protein